MKEDREKRINTFKIIKKICGICCVIILIVALTQLFSMRGSIVENISKTAVLYVVALSFFFQYKTIGMWISSLKKENEFKLKWEVALNKITNKKKYTLKDYRDLAFIMGGFEYSFATEFIDEKIKNTGNENKIVNEDNRVILLGLLFFLIESREEEREWMQK